MIIVNVAGEMLPNLPGFDVLRDLALAMYPALLLWAVGCVVLWRRNRTGILCMAGAQSKTAAAAA